MPAWLSSQQLVFLVPLGFGVLLSIANALGLGDLELDVDADMDVDVDADMDVDADADAEGDGHGVGFGLLELLGVGRVPLLLIVIGLLLCFGLVGLIGLRALSAWLPPALAMTGAIGAASVGSVLLVSRIARLVSRVVPSLETYATDKRALVGHSGRVVLALPASDGGDPGRVAIVDETGTRFEVRARGTDGPLARGSEVLLTEFDPEREEFTAEPFSL